VQQAPGITLAVSPASASMQSLATAKLTVTATGLGGVTAASGAAGASISVASGLPKGLTAAWSAPGVTTAGAVVWTLTLTGSATAVAGTSTLNLMANVTAAKTGTVYAASKSVTLVVTLSPPVLTLATATSSVSAARGSSATEAVTITGNATYIGAVTLSVSGLPAGVTAAWSKNPLTLSGESGSATLTLTAAGTAVAGSTTITIKAAGDGVTASKTMVVQVVIAAGAKGAPARRI